MPSRIRPERSQVVEEGGIFGRLIVLARSLPNKRGQAIWRCRCSCGTEKAVRASSLKGGIASSCGCFRIEMQPTIRLDHGEKPKRGPTPEYRAWVNMITRCTNPRYNRWKHYGGRGITICERWRSSYEAFLEDVGRKPSSAYSIDRINVDGNYEPGNVRWATDIEQANNKQKRVS